MKRPNDIGGSKAGPVIPNAHEPADWQKELTALLSALGPTARHYLWVDEFRRAREDIPEDFYNTLSYFELWTEGLARLMAENGFLTRDEIVQRMAEIREAQASTSAPSR